MLILHFLTNRETETAWYIISKASVCQFIFATFSTSPRNAGRFVWRSSGQGQGHSHRSKRGRQSLFPQCKTSSGNNSASVTRTAVKFACSMGFLIWQIELCNDHLHHVTGSGHAELKARIRGWSASDSKEILLMLSFVYCRWNQLAWYSRHRW